MDKTKNSSKKSTFNVPFSSNNMNNNNTDNMQLKTMKVSELYKNFYSKDAGKAIHSLKENYLNSDITKSILKNKSELSSNGLPQTKLHAIKNKPIASINNQIHISESYSLNDVNQIKNNSESINKIQNPIIFERYLTSLIKLI